MEELDNQKPEQSTQNPQDILTYLETFNQSTQQELKNIQEFMLSESAAMPPPNQADFDDNGQKSSKVLSQDLEKLYSQMTHKVQNFKKSMENFEEKKLNIFKKYSKLVDRESRTNHDFNSVESTSSEESSEENSFEEYLTMKSIPLTLEDNRLKFDGRLSQTGWESIHVSQEIGNKAPFLT